MELNPARDLLQSLAAKLYSLPKMYAHFVQARLDFSLLGLGVSLENAVPVADIESAVELMLAEIKKENKRLLIISQRPRCVFQNGVIGGMAL